MSFFITKIQQSQAKWKGKDWGSALGWDMGIDERGKYESIYASASRNLGNQKIVFLESSCWENPMTL